MNITKYKYYIDQRGDLLPIELKNIPFKVKRIFVISNTPKNTIRGGHAHYKTQQILICIQGKIEVNLDYGNNKRKKIVITQGEMVHIPKLVWDSQKFLTDKDFMVCLCSTTYNKKDYIEDINLFYKLTNNKVKK